MNQVAISNDESCFKLALKDGTHFGVDSQMVDMYQMAYPKIDVRAELGSMVAWHYSNESKRKTRRGIKRSINSWLSGANNKSASQPAAQTQRSYATNTSIQDQLQDDSWAQ